MGSAVPLGMRCARGGLSAAVRTREHAYRQNVAVNSERRWPVCVCVAACQTEATPLEQHLSAALRSRGTQTSLMTPALRQCHNLSASASHGAQNAQSRPTHRCAPSQTSPAAPRPQHVWTDACAACLTAFRRAPASLQPGVAPESGPRTAPWRAPGPPPQGGGWPRGRRAWRVRQALRSRERAAAQRPVQSARRGRLRLTGLGG
jgi:hypothetical protein